MAPESVNAQNPVPSDNRVRFPLKVDSKQEVVAVTPEQVMAFFLTKINS